MKLSTVGAGDGIVTAQPYLGPIDPAETNGVVKLESPTPAPAEAYSAAYSPHSPIRSVGEVRGYQSQVKISEDVLPQGVPMLPEEPNPIYLYLLVAASAFLLMKIIK